MRREGLEFQVSKPSVITDYVGKTLHEPYELLTIDAVKDFIGPLTEELAKRLSYLLDIKTDIKRHESIKLDAQDIEGNAISLEADGLFSICIQHEIDHLDGKLFIDYISDIKLQRLRKKIAKQNKAERIEKQKSTRLI